MKPLKKNNEKNVMKKIATTGIIAAMTVTCLITTAMPAFANTEITYGNGQATVTNVEGNETTFNAFKIFMANKNADGTMSNFAWPSTAVRDAVLGVIKSHDSTFKSTNAQDAADFISRAYLNASGELTTDQTTILDNKELLNEIAAAVDDTAVQQTIVPGEATSLGEGYWLIVTDGKSVGTDEDGTSPIYMIAGGGNITIAEKTSIPTVDKLVLNDAVNASWTYGAEAERGQSVEHKVTGTIAKNVKTYDTYYYEFVDVMSKGIIYDSESFSVSIDGKDVTSAFTEKYSKNTDKTSTLSVACNDLKSISGIELKADSKVVLTYTVQLNDDCVVGIPGNPNDVHIVYSSNPNTNEKSTTHTVRDYLYTFQLHLEKKDRDTNVSLKGAKFTIQATDPDDTESKGLYVQADGRLGKTAYEFVTDKDGIINVTGLDAGTYTLHETEAPEMYQVVNKDTVFKIEASYNENGTLATLSNTVSGNADAAAGIDTTNDNKVNGDEGSAVAISDGIVNVTVGNIEKVKMPLSGQNGIYLIIAAGIGVIGISAAGIILAGKKKKDNENAKEA